MSITCTCCLRTVLPAASPIMQLHKYYEAQDHFTQIVATRASILAEHSMKLEYVPTRAMLLTHLGPTAIRTPHLPCPSKC